MFKKLYQFILKKFFPNSYQSKKSYYQMLFLTSLSYLEDYEAKSKKLKIECFYNRKQKTFYVLIDSRFCERDIFTKFNDEVHSAFDILSRTIYYPNLKIILNNQLFNYSDENEALALLDNIQLIYEKIGVSILENSETILKK